MKNLKVSALQLDLIWHDAGANRAHIEALVSATQPQGSLIVLPEMFTTGFSMEPAGLAERTNGPTAIWMQQMAKKQDASLLGSMIITEGEHFYNRALLVNEQGLQAQYDKRHSFSLAGEDKVFSSGTEKVIIEVEGWKICLQICYDLRFPAYSRNIADEDGNYEYDLLIYVANWPATRVQHWESLLQARAIENQSYVIGVNRVGEDGNGLYYSGSSMIVDPMGKLIAKASGGEAVLEAELSADFLSEMRGKFPFWRDADRFTIES
ncbi:MAG: amidohydrolase [Bacteroidia bacterium]